MIDVILADELLAGQLDLMRFEALVRSRVLATLERMRVELSAQLRSDDLTVMNRARLTSLLKQTDATVSKYYAAISDEVAASQSAVGRAAASNTSSALRTGGGAYAQLGGGLPTEAFLARLASSVLIQGAASADWWKRQSLSSQFRFANAVRQGATAGETNEQIVLRVVGSVKKGIPGAIDVSRREARTLVHASLQATAAAARMESYRKNADVLDHVDWLATLDGSTCPNICGPRDLKPYTLMDDPPQPIGHALPWNGGPGAIHIGCRCIPVAARKTFAQLGLPGLKEPSSGQRASIYGPVPATTSFEDFLKRRGTKFQEEVLGVGRAELYRQGKLTLSQLLDLRGNPLTLAQLRRKYG